MCTRLRLKTIFQPEIKITGLKPQDILKFNFEIVYNIIFNLNNVDFCKQALY